MRFKCQLENESSEKLRLSNYLVDAQKETQAKILINQETEAKLLSVKNELNGKINTIKQSYED